MVRAPHISVITAEHIESFFALTPERVLHAVEDAGFEPSGHVMALHCLENRVHDVRLDDGTHVITKFYRPGRWTAEQIRQEHDFLFEMQEAEIPVCAPLRFLDDTLHEVEGIFYAVWPRVGGRSPDELNEEQVDILGRLLARIHAVGAVGDADRLVLDADSYGRSNAEFLADRGFLPPQWVGRYQDAVEAIAEIYEERVEGVPLHRIHADCHLGNLLNGRDGWFFLDFDDMALGPAVQDIWLVVPGRDPETLALRDRLLDAYRQFADFEPRWLRLIEPLRALRFVRYAAWVARRWNDPAFKASYPHFNTEQYWQNETIDLEQQLQRIRADQDSTW